jgi:hypothetical protein
MELYTLMKFTTGLFIEGGNSTSLYDTDMIIDGYSSSAIPNTVILSGGGS